MSKECELNLRREEVGTGIYKDQTRRCSGVCCRDVALAGVLDMAQQKWLFAQGFQVDEGFQVVVWAVCSGVWHSLGQQSQLMACLLFWVVFEKV